MARDVVIGKCGNCGGPVVSGWRDACGWREVPLGYIVLAWRPLPAPWEGNKS